MEMNEHDFTDYKIKKSDYERLLVNKNEKNMMFLGEAENDNIKFDDNISVYKNLSCDKCDLRIHNYFEIMYVSTGECSVEIKNHVIQAKERNIIFISPGVPHSINIDAKSEVISIVISKNIFKNNFYKIVDIDSTISRFITNALWNDVVNDYMFFYKCNNSSVFHLLKMIVYEEIYPNDFSIQIKSSLLMALLGYMSSIENFSYEISSGKIIKSDQITKILGYIYENYRTVTLEKLAVHFHYTVPYVSKLISTSTGMTFTEILREIKFDVCRSLLINSDLKINRIAEIAGYQNTDHFNRVFKRKMGITPSDYKKDMYNSGIDKKN